MNKKLVLALMGMTAAAGIASAANIDVSSDITTSVTWSSNNVYNLTKQLYVRSGATLTIPAGTLIKSTTGVGGSLAVSRGGKIYVNGTASAPVIMTSTSDNMTSWHVGANEWGNLTIMGKGLISASLAAGNTATPTGLNVKQMEGLTADGINDVVYGGNNDNDDSGSIHYLSLRYGGKVIGLANELNGLSLGGIGRATDIDHVEIMNNVDDGIEIWGGTVNLKYVNIWNIGDDSMDIDQGWRGKAQFGLIVQGYSVDAAQGSGWGDNCFEMDGAEDSDAQPVTTAAIYNFTTIGQPLQGDQGTAWRDGARVQFGNCIWMDLGEALVKNDNADGDGSHGYGYNGTLSWINTWTTPYTSYSPVNAGTFTPGAFNDPAVMYTAQSAGNLVQIKDSVFFQNAFASAYTEADARGVRGAANNNVTVSVLPIQLLQRAPSINIQSSKAMLMVTNINPCAANDAVTSVATAPNDGFFTPAQFRGGFSADNNWLKGWTAIDAYGMTSGSATVDPSTTIQMTASTFFQTIAGKVYTVEQSSDMQNWSPVAMVTGDGSIKSATDLAAFDSAKFYRAIIQ